MHEVMMSQHYHESLIGRGSRILGSMIRKCGWQHEENGVWHAVREP
uniref:Uncharacterized protein n=1 Tax=Manihot esculenta TaxID=3983 RepID=A0A2C9VJQ3_MANES